MRRLIRYAEENFDCEFGPQKAFFELPQRGGDVVRGIYRSYVIRGPDYYRLQDWMIDNVLQPLMWDTDGEGLLYWRLPDRFEVQLDGETYTLRTRICVLRRGALDEQIAKDAMHTEGADDIKTLASITLPVRLYR